MVVSGLPGISGVTLMALAIPFTIAWEPLPVFLLFGSLVGGATFMGSVTSILMNIPGKTSNAATMIDGYPMARNGEARTAIGCSAAASALGSTFGVVMLIALIPVMRRAILLLGAPELLVLILWGLATIAIVTRGSVIKGLAAAGLGFLLAFVGLDPRTGEARFTGDILYLRDGLELVPVFLGIFAVAEVIDLMASGRRTISGERTPEQLSGSVTAGVRSIFEHFGLFLRSSAIGTVVGMIPGVGGTVASFIAYGHAAQSAGDGGRFGDGDIRGVLAPEAANDAKDAGALIPTLAFGIPGGTGTAMLLAVLTLHGIVPGQAMMEGRLDMVFVLIWSLLLSNWLTSLLGVGLVGPLTRLTVVRTDLLVPVILSLVTVGAYVNRSLWQDIAVATAFGIFGFFMKKFGWSRIPFVIALVLAPLFETYFHITVQLQELGRIDIWTRPIAVTLFVGGLSAFAVHWLRRNRPRPEDAT
jgi:putative tricarboxylic transport membrane protein